jgi:anti-anti-sigma factor
MKIETRTTERAIFLNLTEDPITPKHAEEVERALDKTLEQGPANVVVNLSQVKLVNNRTWGIIARFARKLRPRGKDIKLAGLDPLLDKDFKTIKLSDVLESYSTEDDALASFTDSVSHVERNLLFKLK